MNCPICSAKLSSTGIKNKIFNSDSYYCNACHSYHILDKIDDSEYYAEKYHTAFNYKKIVSAIINKLGLVSNRCISRYRYIKKHVRFSSKMSYLEIGGGSGENFVIYNARKKPELYTIIEPNSKFNLKNKKLRYFNDIFENISTEKLIGTNVVMIFHVLEHIYDLEIFFEKLKNVNPQYFYFEVPNIDNKIVLDDSLKNHPHYHHFSIKSIDYMLNKQGFTKIALDGIDPKSYHPYKKIGTFKRYLKRILGKNESFNDKGLYIRGIYQIKEK